MDELQKLTEILTGTGNQNQAKEDALKTGFMYTALLFLLREHTKKNGDQLLEQIAAAFKTRYLVALRESLKEQEKIAKTPMGQIFGSVLEIDSKKTIVEAAQIMEKIVDETKKFVAMSDENAESIRTTYNEAFNK